jgi:predicted nucleic acid-binding protein
VVTRVFVDTSALLALLDRADSRHAQAREAFTGLADAELVSHGYVVAETLAVTRRRLGVDATIAVIDDLLPAIDVLPVAPTEHASAVARYRASLPSGTSFVDQVSFQVIEREGIGTAFVLDSDFAVTGVEMLPAAQREP